MKEIHYVTADEAVAAIRSGDHIHLGSVASVPHVLIDALVRRADAGEVEDLHFHHFHTEGAAILRARFLRRPQREGQCQLRIR